MKLSKEIINILDISDRNRSFILDNRIWKLDNTKYRIVTKNMFVEQLFNDFIGMKKDNIGNIVELIFEDNVSNEFEYDDKNRITKRLYISNDYIDTISYKYDDEDRIIEKNDCGNISTYEYADGVEIEYRGEMVIEKNIEYNEILSIKTKNKSQTFKLTPITNGYEYRKEDELLRTVIFKGNKKIITYKEEDYLKVDIYEGNLLMSSQFGDFQIFNYRYDENNNLVACYKHPVDIEKMKERYELLFDKGYLVALKPLNKVDDAEDGEFQEAKEIDLTFVKKVSDIKRRILFSYGDENGDTDFVVMKK